MSAKTTRLLSLGIGAIATIYAFSAGLRTVSDPDLGWQLATGRWIVQNHKIPYTDVLSYTAAGKEWAYPVLSQVIFYWTYLLGGYSLLSWLSAAACVATTALLLRGNTVSKCLGVIAVPIIAIRTAPRAELFTAVLFAAFVTILWNYHRSGRGPLWSLPLLMALWVNLHLGFIAGLGMCGAYVFLEMGEAVFPARRTVALARLRRVVPWVMATLVATLLTPWGVGIYSSMMKLMPVQSNKWILELMSVPVTASAIAQEISWRDPRSAVWWLVAAAILAAVAAALQRRFATVVILGASTYLVFHAVRFQGPFATVIAIIGGSVLSDGFENTWLKQNWDRLQTAVKVFKPAPVLVGTIVVLSVFAGARIRDLATDDYFLRTPLQYSFFGTGIARTYPEDAAAFLRREKIPGNVFNEYNIGGFAAWRLGPEYPDYLDGRGVPFGANVFFHSIELLGESLDSPQWQQEAESRNINAVLISLDYELGGALPNLKLFCDSQSWRPVYMDTSAAVFVRRRPETASIVDRLQFDCNQVRFDAAPAATGVRGRSEQFIYHRNAGAILINLGRIDEGLRELEQAERLFEDCGNLHYLKGLALIYQRQRWADSEKELRRALELETTEEATFTLAKLYENQSRYREAARILAQAIPSLQQPYRLYLELGSVQSILGQQRQALLSFDRAEKESPFDEGSTGLAAEFRGQLAEERALAWRSLGNLQQATSFQEQSVRFTPGDPRRWLALAELYEARGLMQQALFARQRAGVQ